MILEQTVAELGELDRALKSVETGDVEKLAALLENRALRVQQAASEIARLRQAAQPVPAGTREALEQSVNAGMHSMRQVIFAKHLLAAELTKLKQEQRLLEALACDAEAPRSRLEITA